MANGKTDTVVESVQAGAKMLVDVAYMMQVSTAEARRRIEHAIAVGQIVNLNKSPGRYRLKIA